MRDLFVPQVNSEREHEYLNKTHMDRFVQNLYLLRGKCEITVFGKSKIIFVAAMKSAPKMGGPQRALLTKKKPIPRINIDLDSEPDFSHNLQTLPGC
jgi:hypothetical protein